MAHNHKSHPQAPLYGPGGTSSTGILTQLKQYEGALSIGWSQLTSVPTTISGYGITDAYTESEVDALLAGKADVATTLAGYGITDAYTKTEVDTLLSGKADTGDSYTKAEADALLDDKADSATTLAGYGITDAYTKTAVDALLPALVVEASLSGGIAQSLSGTSTIIFDTLISGSASDYDTATGIFTAPATGKYLVFARARVSWTTGTSSDCGMLVIVNAISGKGAGGAIVQSSTVADGGLASFVPLTAGDTLFIRLISSGGTRELPANGNTRLQVVRLI